MLSTISNYTVLSSLFPSASYRNPFHQRYYSLLRSVVLIRIALLLQANGHPCLFGCLCLESVGERLKTSSNGRRVAGRSKRVSAGSVLWNSQRDRRAWVSSSCSLTLILNPSSSWSKCGPVDPEKTPTAQGKCYRRPDLRGGIVRGLAAKRLTQIHHEIIECG